MIHGLVGSLDYFKPTERTTQARVYTYDLLGYGKWKDVPPSRLTLDTQVDHVTRSIVELTDHPVWLLGHSMGGAIVMLLADRHPGLVRGVINVEGNFTLKDAFWSSKIIAQPLTQWEHKYHTMRSDIPRLAGRLRYCSYGRTRGMGSSDPCLATRRHRLCHVPNPGRADTKAGLPTSRPECIRAWRAGTLDRRRAFRRRLGRSELRTATQPVRIQKYLESVI